MTEYQKLIPANYKVFIDTCSLMQPLTLEFVSNNLIPALKNNGASVTVPPRVLDELRKLQKKEGDTGTLAAAGLKAVAFMLTAGVLEFYGGDENDTFADNFLIYTFTRLRLKYDLALITQDKKLAMDIHDLANHRSVNWGNNILLFKIKEGKLAEWDFSNNQQIEARKTKYQLCAAPRKDFGDTLSLVETVPATGDRVYSPKYGEIVLREKIAEIKDGTIYHIKEGLGCKIYHPRHLTMYRSEKLARMLEVPFKIKGISWPLDILKDQNGCFVGYLQPGYTGKPLKEAVFSKKSLQENFPHWTRKELVDLCLAILEPIKSLHELNVLLGDINPSNIYIANEKDIYICGTDNCQIEDFPCQHNDKDFLAPELRGQKSGTYLQTKGQEYYGLAVLLFMILLPGKHPFAFHGVKDSRMRCLEFPYPLGEKKARNSLVKPWKYIWSNMPYKVKRMFHEVFSENKRVEPSEWIKVLHEYRLLIANSYTSNEIFPARHKILNPCEVTCSRCGIKEEKEEKWVESLILKGKIYYCETCLEKIRQGE